MPEIEADDRFPERLPPGGFRRRGIEMSRLAPAHPVSGGLSLGQLQAYNPTVNPLAMTPGERLNLCQHPPQPHKPKPPGPMFWVVWSGQPFGSIAASTGIGITTLEQLNPTLPPANVQPGDRVRLRH